MIDEALALITAEVSSSRAPCVTCSFQVDCVVLLDLVRRVAPRIPVLFLDTWHHFQETLAYRDDMVRRWDLNLIVLSAREPQPGLWRESTTACCAKHKVEPLFAALEQYDLWVSGLRRAQSPSRAQLEPIDRFTLPGGTELRKASPLAHWTTTDVGSYAKQHDIPLLPLYARGYTSIGCEPCTTLPDHPANPRSGRWKGQKLECGIHVGRGGTTR